MPFSSGANGSWIQTLKLGTIVDCFTKSAIAAVLEKAPFYFSHQLSAGTRFEPSNLGSLIKCSTKWATVTGQEKVLLSFLPGASGSWIQTLKHGIISDCSTKCDIATVLENSVFVTLSPGVMGSWIQSLKLGFKD